MKLLASICYAIPFILFGCVWFSDWHWVFKFAAIPILSFVEFVLFAIFYDGYDRQEDWEQEQYEAYIEQKTLENLLIYERNQD